MSLTPDLYFNGSNACTGCEKSLEINDRAIVFRPLKMGDFMFCVPCAVKMTMSIAQDISRIADGYPDIAFESYDGFNRSPTASEFNLRRHSEALKKLAGQLNDYADAVALFGEAKVEQNAIR